MSLPSTTPHPPTYLQVPYIIIIMEICKVSNLQLNFFFLNGHNTHNVHQDGKCYPQFSKQLDNADCSRYGSQSVRSAKQMNKSFCQAEARRYKLNFTPVLSGTSIVKALYTECIYIYISLWTDAGDSSSTPSGPWLFSSSHFSCYYSNINNTVISLFVAFYSFKNNC